MTLEQLKTVLEGTGFPVAYRALDAEDIKQNRITLPWVAYMNNADQCFSADNTTYYKSMKVTVELFERLRDETNEGKVETALTNAGIFFTKDYEYLEDEKCYGIIYIIEV